MSDEKKTQTQTETPETPALDEQSEREKRRAEINTSAKTISANDFVCNYLPKRPPISKEYVPEANPFVLDDSNPHRCNGRTASAGSDGASRADWPVDSKRIRFDPEKHLLTDSGEPAYTATGRFKTIPKADRDNTAVKQLARWNAIRANEGNESADEPEESKPEPDEIKNEAGKWVDFCECLFAFAGGDAAKMGNLPNGASEKEMFTSGLSSAFARWKLLRFPAILGFAFAAGTYAHRVYKTWAANQPKEPKRAQPDHEPNEPTERGRRVDEPAEEMPYMGKNSGAGGGLATVEAEFQITK
ncbi:MAG: hypothetical protein CML13_16030 [Puniceicoccaceae bacterium]|nr:hypothetical protein [Puniceicoccaceae bacterium]|tara:strand:+ start:7088 stop:7990 length:903 start_codon:yes stop_codon:yes gene_type:complete